MAHGQHGVDIPDDVSQLVNHLLQVTAAQLHVLWGDGRVDNVRRIQRSAVLDREGAVSITCSMLVERSRGGGGGQ